MRHLLWKTFLLAAALTVPACGSSDDEPKNDIGPGAADGQTAGSIVLVSFADQQHPVDLDSLSTVEVAGAQVIPLAEVVQSALPQQNLTDLAADFLDSQGATPSSKDFCKDIIPVGGQTLSQGYIHPQSHNLSWEDSLDYPGCMSWRDIVEIVVSAI